MKRYCDTCGVRMGRIIFFLLLPMVDEPYYEFKNKDGTISRYCCSCMKKRKKDV